MKQIYILTTLLFFSINNINAQQVESLNFDGIDDYIDLNNGLSSSLNFKNSFTVEAIVYNTTVTGPAAMIIGNHATGPATQFALRRVDDEYQLILGFGVHSLITTTSAAVLNTWQHVTVVKDYNDLKIYIDGALVASSTISSYSLPYSTSKVFIGTNSFNELFTGSIDEIRIWEDARTESEISNNIYNELSPPQTGLLAYYKFNQGVANGNNSMEIILNDEIGNSHGTLFNFALNGTTSNWTGDNALSIDDISLFGKEIKLYPNPITNFFQISGLTNTEEYKIFNLIGSEVKSGNVMNNQKVDILNLTTGIYLLKFDNGYSIKFIKE